VEVSTDAMDGRPDEKVDILEDTDTVRQEGMDWFVLRVASNKESSVQNTLLRKVQIEGMTHLVGRILVPTEKTKTIKGGKQKITETKLYPGYVFVEMRLEEDGRIPQDVFFLIKETTGVGDFVGTAGRPTPMAEHEIEKMLTDSKRPTRSRSSSSASRRARRSPSRRAPSRTTRAPSTSCCPRRASSASSSRSSAARPRSSSRSGRSPRPTRPRSS
jgi:transcription antitermination factor NusG